MSEQVRQFYEARIRLPAEYAFDEFASDVSLGFLQEEGARVGIPAAVLEAADFYFENVLDSDNGDVRTFRVTVEGTPTYAVRVVTDGGDGFLEVFDGAGQLLGAGRTAYHLVVWGNQREWRTHVFEGEPNMAFMAEIAARPDVGSP